MIARLGTPPGLSSLNALVFRNAPPSWWIAGKWEVVQKRASRKLARLITGSRPADTNFYACSSRRRIRLQADVGPPELEDERLFKTGDFDCSRLGNLRTVFGTRLRLLFAIGIGLRCRGEKRDPVPDFLTSSAFTRT